MVQQHVPTLHTIMIGELTAGVSSARMARPLRFFNVVRSFTLLYSL